MKKRIAASGLVVASVVVAACGSDPKPEPTAPTATPPASTPAPSAEPSAPASAAPSASASAKPDKQTECDALVDEANNTLDAERIAVDKACKKDADCMPVKGRACSFNCVNAAIPKAEEKDWTESLTKVKDGACKKWTANECEKLRTKPLPTCQDRKVACNKGHCELK